MSIPDLVNASFELMGGIFTLMHCTKLRVDKQVKGVSVTASMFFLSWGLWNLYYYPSLGQWLSFYGGIALASTNILWITMMFYYKKYPDGRNP